MSEEKEEKKIGWFDAIAQMKKINPVAFMLAFSCMMFFSHLLRSGEPLEVKIAPMLLSLFYCWVTLGFEAYRINKEQENKEKIWRKKVLG